MMNTNMNIKADPYDEILIWGRILRTFSSQFNKFINIYSSLSSLFLCWINLTSPAIQYIFSKCRWNDNFISKFQSRLSILELPRILYFSTLDKLISTYSLIKIENDCDFQFFTALLFLYSLYKILHSLYFSPLAFRVSNNFHWAA